MVYQADDPGRKIGADHRMNLTKTSKFIALILRHKLETIGISLYEHGWAETQELLEGINATDKHHIDMSELEEFVRTDEKQRYSFSEDKTLIRANQGHSIPVDVELKKCTPQYILYHGTGEKYVVSMESSENRRLLRLRTGRLLWLSGCSNERTICK